MTTGPALACPRHLLCIVQPGDEAAEIAQARGPARAVPDVRTVSLAPDDNLTFGEAPPKANPDEIEVPWIWRVLREQVHSRLPRYEEQTFSLMITPVVVTSPSDTIPGLGVGGVF